MTRPTLRLRALTRSAGSRPAWGTSCAYYRCVPELQRDVAPRRLHDRQAHLLSKPQLPPRLFGRWANPSVAGRPNDGFSRRHRAYLAGRVHRAGGIAAAQPLASESDRMEAAATVGEDRSGTASRRTATCRLSPAARRTARSSNVGIGLADRTAAQPRSAAGCPSATTVRAGGSRAARSFATGWLAPAARRAPQHSAPTDSTSASRQRLAECSSAACDRGCDSRSCAAVAEIGTHTAACSDSTPGDSHET